MYETRYSDDQTIDLTRYFGVLRRQHRPFVLTAGVLLSLSIVVALFWPPIYRSSATIHIEEQVIPSDLIRSAVTSSASQRIATTSQRLMTRQNLLRIIEQYDLYAEARKEKSIEKIVKGMRKRIEIDVISIDVADPASGRRGEIAIGLKVSFSDRNPVTAQKITEELASLFLDSSASAHTKRMARAVEFLAAESGKLKKEIEQYENRLTLFKEANTALLPELKELNQRMGERTDQRLFDMDDRMRTLEQRKFQLQGQLAQINPLSPTFLSNGQRVLDPVSKTRALHSEYLSLSAKYGAEHPDVVRLRREIQLLDGLGGGAGITTEYARELVRLRVEQVAISEKYTADHPDAIRLGREIAALEKASKGVEATELYRTPVNVEPDNPAFITIHAQLMAVNSEIESITVSREQLKTKIADYEQRVIESPGVEQEYIALKREHEDVTSRYREINAKQMELQVRSALEKEHGEQFSVIEPALIPEEAVKPNRYLILFFGTVLSLMGGLVSVAVAEAKKGGGLRFTEQEPIRLEAALKTIDVLHDTCERKQARITSADRIIRLLVREIDRLKQQPKFTNEDSGFLIDASEERSEVK